MRIGLVCPRAIRAAPNRGVLRLSDAVRGMSGHPPLIAGPRQRGRPHTGELDALAGLPAGMVTDAGVQAGGRAGLPRGEGGRRRPAL